MIPVTGNDIKRLLDTIHRYETALEKIASALPQPSELGAVQEIAAIALYGEGNRLHRVTP